LRGLRFVSPSRFAVITKHLPEEEEVDRRTKSAGKVSFSLTITISPTWKITGAVTKTSQEITETVNSH